MNRRKSAANLGFPSLVLLAIAVVIVSAAGIGYVLLKNQQITTRSEISRVQKRMEQHQVSIKLHRTDIDETLGYYRLRDRLIEMNSTLTEIESVEIYRAPDELNPLPDRTLVHR